MVQAISAPRRINVISSALPSWIPQPGQVGIVPVSNLFHTAPVNPCPDSDCEYTVGSAGNRPVICVESGGCAASDYGPLGAVIIHGGGHGNYKGNEAYALVLGETCFWERLIDPIDDPIISAGSNPGDTINVAESWGEYVGFPNELGSNHSWDWPSYWPAAFGGGAKGSFVMPVATAVGRESALTRKSHRIDLNNLGARWQRIGDGLTTSPSATQEGGGTCFDPVRNGFWAKSRQGSGISFLQMPSGVWSNRTLTGYGTVSSYGYTGPYYIPGLDIVIFVVCPSTAPQKIVWAQLGATLADITGWHTATIIGNTMPRTLGMGGDVCSANGKVYFTFGTDGYQSLPLSDVDTRAIWELTIPDPPTGNWTMTKLLYQGSPEAVSAWNDMSGRSRFGPWRKFAWFASIGCYVYPQAAADEGNVTQYNNTPDSERVLCFKPPAS